MRMRKKKNLEQRISDCGELVLCSLFEPHEHNDIESKRIKEDFFKMFDPANPVHLEIGCGKGGFINTFAEKNSEIHCFALEKSRNVVITAMESTRDSGLHNIKYIIGMAEYLERVFPANSVDLIYLNFSCPYPKNSYASRRLTHEKFLDIYRRLLKPGGMIKQKTDNDSFFNFSINSFKQNNYTLKNITRDLHNSKIKGNIITEYESIFSKQGVNINYLEAFSNI